MKRRATTICVDCGAAKGDFHGLRQRCAPCDANFWAQVMAASHAVRCAIRAGELPKARTLTCVDCGGPALDWEHRDYSKPLAVEPTCRRCNQQRGPALYARLPQPAPASDAEVAP